MVILFFSVIIIIYYRMLYNEKRNNIIKTGEVTAKESAEQIDQYLSTNIDSVKLAAYTLDSMIEEKRSDEEIQNYLVDQSTAVRSAVIENSTGLYGYINGRFFSGTNWIPPEDYDAKERPWYTRPMETPGEMTILDPYVDVQSGNVMLALGKTLCDGVSVISVDVSLEQIQKLTEDAVKSGNSDIEMILNDKRVVVAHSDREELGKDYGKEEGTLGAEIVKGLNTAQDGCFEFVHGGANYLVYAADMQNGWFCISVNDATRVYGSLRLIFFITITVVIAIVLIISAIMTRSGRYLQMSARAKAESEAKSVFLSNMSHELRTPINAILGMNEMILRESDDAMILSYSEKVKTSGKDLLRLVDDILDFSGIEEEKSGMTEETVTDNTAATQKYRESFTAPDACILVVDDNPLNLTVFKNLVKQTGITVDTAGSGDEGISLAGETKYDMIFLDHMMPGKDGIETLGEIRKREGSLNYRTPAICLTANAITGAREQYLSAGFDGYLTKPIDPEQLEKMMLSFLPEEKVETLRQEEPGIPESPGDRVPEVLEALLKSPIDPLAGLKNSGTTEAYLALLKIFYESIEEKAEELNRFYREEDYKNYTIRVHSLKSSARIIGAAGFGEEAQKLEDAGKAEDKEYIHNHHEPFMDEFLTFKEPLREVFSAYESEHGKPEADPDLMSAVMEEIKAGAGDMDCERLDSIFGEMEGYRISEGSRELYGKLKEASEKYEYKTIVKLLDDEGIA